MCPTCKIDSLELVQRFWMDIDDAVREQSEAVQVLVREAEAVRVEGYNTLVIQATTASIAQKLNEERNKEIIRKALDMVLGVNWDVSCIA